MRMPPGQVEHLGEQGAGALAEVSAVGGVDGQVAEGRGPAFGVVQAVTHLPRVRCSRTAISAAAAALVKVRHWMRSGFAPASIRRSRARSVSSLVLPEPAEAATNADTAGSDAASCSRLARSRGVKAHLRRATGGRKESEGE